jgi:hypothetical protein
MTSVVLAVVPVIRAFRLPATVISLGLMAGCAGVQAPVAQSNALAIAAVPPTPQTAPSASAPVRHVGDLFVHRFSGSFASDPLTLTEEVAAREPNAWVVDFSLTQSEKVERLRVRFDAKTGQPVSAVHLDAGRETAAQLSEYDALLARTVYTADVNDGLVSTNAQTCLVSTDALDCETKTYKVWVGDRPATLSVVHSSSFADRDVSGEITTDDGKLVYRAELVEAKQGKPAIGIATR